MNLMGLEELLKGAASDPAVAELFGGVDALKEIERKRKLEGEARLKVAQAVLSVFNTEAGLTLFEYLASSYLRRFDDIGALGLPMETAIQVYAGRNAEQQLVKDLFRMMNEARNPKPSTSHEA